MKQLTSLVAFAILLTFGGCEPSAKHAPGGSVADLEEVLRRTRIVEEYSSDELLPGELKRADGLRELGEIRAVLDRLQPAPGATPTPQLKDEKRVRKQLQVLGLKRTILVGLIGCRSKYLSAAVNSGLQLSMEEDEYLNALHEILGPLGAAEVDLSPDPHDGHPHPPHTEPPEIIHTGSNPPLSGRPLPPVRPPPLRPPPLHIR